MNDGFYYLHTNGSLIRKQGLPGTEEDLRGSTFVRAYWPVNTDDRATAWRIAVEALAAGADPARVAELSAMWGLTDQDGAIYAERIGVAVERRSSDGACAIFIPEGKNIEGVPPSDNFRPTVLAALSVFAQQLGYYPGANLEHLVASRQGPNTSSPQMD
jgi:hypothetical protein